MSDPMDIFNNIEEEGDPLLDDAPQPDIDDIIDEDTTPKEAAVDPKNNPVTGEKGHGKDVLVRKLIEHRMPLVQTTGFTPPKGFMAAPLETPVAHPPGDKQDETTFQNADAEIKSGASPEDHEGGPESSQVDEGEPSDPDDSGDDLHTKIDEAQKKRELEQEEEEKRRLQEEEAKRRNQQDQQPQKPKDLTDTIVDGAGKLVGGSMALGGAAATVAGDTLNAGRTLAKNTATVASDLYKALSEKVAELYDQLSYKLLDFKNDAQTIKEDGAKEASSLSQSANDAMFESGPANRLATNEDPITPTAMNNATQELGLNNLAEKMKAFQANHETPVVTANKEARNAFTQKVDSNLKDVESALKLNEVGQIPLTSQKDFKNRMDTASPDERAKVKQSLDNIMQATKDYQKDARSFVQGNGQSAGMDMLTPDTAKSEVEAFDQKAADPGKDLDEDKKKLLAMIGMDDKPLGETMGEMMTGLRDMMAGALGRLTALSSSQNAAAANSPSLTEDRQRLG